jgi:hypothetical protein
MAVACGASNAFIYVNTVIEIHEIGKIVDPPPFN